jgi:hypothetical protein
MDLDATIEPTIGPYEVHEDEWFNDKAAFAAFITVKDPTGSQKLRKFALRRDIMTLQAEGSYTKAKAMIESLGVIRRETQTVIDRSIDAPVDIEPRFITAAELLNVAR